MDVHHIGHRLIKHAVVRHKQLLQDRRKTNLLLLVKIGKRLQMTLWYDVYFIRPPRKERDIGNEVIVLYNDSLSILTFVVLNIANQAVVRRLIMTAALFEFASNDRRHERIRVDLTVRV